MSSTEIPVILLKLALFRARDPGAAERLGALRRIRFGAADLMLKHNAISDPRKHNAALCLQSFILRVRAARALISEIQILMKLRRYLQLQRFRKPLKPILGLYQIYNIVIKTLIQWTG